MIRLERRVTSAVRAQSRVRGNQRLPLLRREGAFSTFAKRPVLLGLGPDDRRIGAVVVGDPLVDALRVTLVVRRVLCAVLLRVALAPSAHRLASLLSVPAHPLATVGASLLRIRVWQQHALARL